VRETPSPSRDNLQRSGQLTPYLSEDTIAAIASAVGGAVAMIRLSGKNAFSIAEKISGKSFSTLEPRKLYRVTLKHEAELLDNALLVKFVQPESFTGEDVVEFQIHGGAFLASRLMEVLFGLGARQALAGEFSFRAVKNGKSSLAQAQAVADLIEASNGSAVELALEKMSGSQNQFLNETAALLRRLAILGEVGIDFSDQDVDEVALPTLKKQIAPVIEKLTHLQTSYSRGTRIQDGIPVALVGLPNAGKSSFFNALLGQDRSIVSEIAGTTRDVVREHITLKCSRASITLRMEDTAGLRLTDNPIEKMGIERSYQAAKRADVVLALFDPTTPLMEIRSYWAELKKECGEHFYTKVVGIITKADLVGALKLKEFRTEIVKLTQIELFAETSAKTGQGIQQAAETITTFCEKWTARAVGEVLLTRLDHLQAVETAISHLIRARKSAEIDLFASDIRQALFAMGPLIGDTLADDVLGKIFSDFCIGK